VRRAAERVAVLIIADLMAFGFARAVRRLLADVLPSTGVLGWIPPAPGYLNGWQYAVALLFGLLITGNYGQGDSRRDPARLLAGCALATALPLWTLAWHGSLTVALLQYTFTVTAVTAVLVAERMLVDTAVGRFVRRSTTAERAVVVTCRSECDLVDRSIALRDPNEFRVVATVHVASHAGDRAISSAEISRALSLNSAEAVAMCDHLTRAQTQFVADAAMAAGCRLLAAPGTFGIVGVQPSVVWRRGQAMIELTAPTLIGQQLVFKRAIDILGAGLGLILFLPLLLVIAVLVKLDSRGPALFRQERVGQGGRRFRILKFRTMVSDAEQQRTDLQSQSLYSDGRLFKVPDDPRVTRLGRNLRRTSLDELPQLWNVLWGEMSLVGPRPPMPCEVALYEAHHYVRFDVKPGITGPWQVAGRNQITDFEKVIALETEYIREWSLWRDLRILGQTLAVVLRMHGAH
jgi:exopolysaccharide biosynthesis polyprenyl glycosylphosphotransferase